jgi:hypothetical protein
MARSYVSIPGSVAIPTRGRADRAAAALTAIPATKLRTTEVAGVALTRITIRGDMTAVSNRVFDELALEQSALEQVVYLHLYRLAVGQERNFCCVSRVELCKRTSLTDRRLGKALAGLVIKGHVTLIERTRDGTVYVVRLPDEVIDTQRPRRDEDTKPLTPRHEQIMAVPTTIGDAVRCAQAAYPDRRWSGALLTEAVMSLLEEGITFSAMPAAFAHFCQVCPAQTPITTINRHLPPQ